MLTTISVDNKIIIEITNHPLKAFINEIISFRSTITTRLSLKNIFQLPLSCSPAKSLWFLLGRRQQRQSKNVVLVVVVVGGGRNSNSIPDNSGRCFVPVFSFFEVFLEVNPTKCISRCFIVSRGPPCRSVLSNRPVATSCRQVVARQDRRNQRVNQMLAGGTRRGKSGPKGTFDSGGVAGRAQYCLSAADCFSVGA